MRGATRSAARSRACIRHFNPRAPCGARRKRQSNLPRVWHFNPRAPCGARHHKSAWNHQCPEFQSTRPLRGATARARRPGATAPISIHALLAGRDHSMPRLKIAAVKFQSTRPLRGATMIGHGEWLPYLFQSTRPLRGATAAGMVLSPPRPHFNPRAPCGARRDRRRGDYARADISIHAPLAGRDSGRPRWQVQAHISIHAPLAGRDCRHDFSDISASRFQSTRPLRGATIHGSHEKAGRNHFNPRAPCGARLKELQDRLTEIAFQSTRPLRGATFQGIPFGLSCKISIHAPLAGCDGQPWIFRCSTRNFNPRTPCGVRLCKTSGHRRSAYFNPRTPCGVRQSCTGRSCQ